jgi:Holliday junction DNA helicase RuvB
VTSNLGIAIQAARLRGEHLDHVLISGLPGLGKTTLAEILARELGVGFRATSGPVIDRPGDLAGILTSLGSGDVLFIDEIHRMPVQVEEYLYSAMEDFKLVIVIDQGPRARTLPIDLNPFTLVGATTREGLLSAPFRARFGIHERLDPYPVEHLMTIVLRSARLLDLVVDPEAARLIAGRSRGTPRLVNRYLRRIRDVAQIAGTRTVDVALASDALERLGLDEAGLTVLDRRLLLILAKAGAPVGLKTLSVALGEEDRTLEDVYEPFLIREGYLAKTARGRVITAQGLAAVGHDPAGGRDALQGELFETP